MTDHIPAHLRLSADHVQRRTDLMAKAAQVSLSGRAPELMSGMAELGRATLARSADMQRGWAEQWKAWGTYAAAINGATTLPKYTEHGMNTIVRAQQLVSEQMTASTELAENATVSYSFLVNRLLEQKT